MKIVQCTQGQTDWQLARVGLPTASDFDELVSPEWKIRTGERPMNYVLKKVAEKIMGAPADTFQSFAMGQGQVLESEAYPWFEGVFDKTVNRVGFCTTDDGRIGCSPDGLLGEDGGLELKCPLPHSHLEYLIGGCVPKQHRAQVQGCLYVTGLKRWTYISYSRYFPALIVEVVPDSDAQEALDKALKWFLSQYDAALAKVLALMPKTGRAA